jgi:agmatinase
MSASANAPASGAFLGLPDELSSYAGSRCAILPVPFERTVSYGSGTADGPAAILTASGYVETWDEELGCDPSEGGIHTLPACDPTTADLAAALAEIEHEAKRHLAAGKFLVTLGGEHSLSAAPARAARAVAGRDIGVVQFDAHADLRDEYEGTPYSHACVMRRLVEDGFPTLAYGIRSLSAPEAALVEERSLPVIWAHQMARDPAGSRRRFEAELARLPQEIYLTFDIDYFDPALVPATGTPEPGGGTWYPTLELLRLLFATKTVLAMDVVELAPTPSHPASDFLTAKLVYKCIGYHGEGSTPPV